MSKNGILSFNNHSHIDSLTYFETVWTGRQFETLSKILVVFQVLPHLRDEVKRLPEEGDSLRNRLCKLLTTPHTEVTVNLHFDINRSES